jgi:hypothetical protein
VHGLTQQVENDAADLHKIGDEMNKLRPAYQRYRDLSERVKAKEERVRLALALLAARPSEIEEDEQGRLREKGQLAELCDVAGVVVDSPQGEARKAPRWKLMREIVRQVVEVQVIDLERAMASLGVKTTRQAIESGLVTHSRTFRIIKRGREKFVSLK